MTPTPGPSADLAAVRSAIDAATAAVRARDAQALAGYYAPDAWLADLAPPLVRRGFDIEGAQAWFDGWGGPVEITARDEEITLAGDLALLRRLQQTRTRTREGEDAAWWARASIVFARTPQGWRIVQEHVSVPFHMDGSYRAAIDLQP
jgi:ketosteroid isomerase-like protein